MGGRVIGAAGPPEVAASMRCSIAESTILLSRRAWKSAYASCGCAMRRALAGSGWVITKA